MQFLSSAELHLGEFFMAEPGKVMLYARKQRGFACYRLRSRGFTMVELLITIVLIGILTTIATSMMRDWAVSNDVNATAAAVESAFDQARQAAVSRGRPVLMMPRAITGNRWKGIVYFVDTDMDGALTDNDEVLGEIAESQRSTVDVDGADAIIFLPNGMSGSASADYRFIDLTDNGNFGHIEVTVCGRNGKDYYRRLMTFTTTGSMSLQSQDFSGQANPPAACYNN